MDELFKLFGLDKDDPLDRASARMATNRYTVPDSLKRVRETNGISQEEAARRMGTDQAAISRLESGARDLKMSTLHRYADAVHAEVQMRVVNTEQPEADRLDSSTSGTGTWVEPVQYTKLKIERR